MEPLFRFVLVRPSVPPDPKLHPISLFQRSALQFKLNKAFTEKATPNRNLVKEAVKDFAIEDGEDFLRKPENTPFAAQLETLQRRIETLLATPDVKINHDVLLQLVQKIFGMDSSQLVKQEKFVQAQKQLRDSILAIKYLPELHNVSIETLCNQLRYCEIIKALAADTKFPENAASLEAYTTRGLVLPEFSKNLGPSLSTVENIEKAISKYNVFAKEQQKKVRDLVTQHQIHRSAIDELHKLPREHFEMSALENVKGAKIDPQLSLDTHLKGLKSFTNALSHATLKQLSLASQPVVKPSEHQNIPKLAEDLAGDVNLAQTSLRLDQLLVHDLTGSRSATVLADKILTPDNKYFSMGAKATPQPKVVFNSLKPSGIKLLSTQTQDLLSTNGGGQNIPVPQLVLQLDTRALSVANELTRLYTNTSKGTIRRVGNVSVRTLASTEPLLSLINQANNQFGRSLFSWPPTPVYVPKTHGNVEPVGIAELIVVKQNLKRYVSADIAHIENVLRGETKTSEFSSKRTTETTTITEEEITTTEERSLESTTRFEMTNETNTVLKEDASVKGSLSVKGKYGPVVEFAASVEGQLSRTKEVSNKVGMTFAKNVTDKAAEKIAKRVLQKSSLTTTNEVINKDTHGFDNPGQTANISGVYQWVNKVYEAQMWNYGVGSMFDLMIPEPAAVLIDMMEKQHDEEMTLTAPPSFSGVKIELISPENVDLLIQIFGATDVLPPPPRWKFYSFTHADGQGNKDPSINFAKSHEINIDEGYWAQGATINCEYLYWKDPSSIDVAIGDTSVDFSDGDGPKSVNLANIGGSVNISLVTFNVGLFAVHARIWAWRDPSALKAWQIQTYGKLKQAHETQVADYEDKLARLQLRAGVAIQGTNPTANLETIRTELKRQCISLFTEQTFDDFGSTQEFPWSGRPPQFRFEEARQEGLYARFFEQAFEWEYMSWVCYPYYWARKTTWAERFQYEDPDPVFNEFLKAGFVRVQVMARPGFTNAIAHFMETGDVWEGKGLPPVNSPMYLSIAAEIAEKLRQPKEETPQGPSWEVVVPTTLVKLRQDDILPRWKPNPAMPGAWIEDEDPTL